MEERNLMALNWDITEVKDAPFKEEGLSEDEKQLRWRKLESMIWASMAVDMPGFDTEGEADEFYNRYAVWCVHKGLDPEFTIEDCKRYIGLRTNVTRLSRFKWDEKQRKLHGFK